MMSRPHTREPKLKKLELKKLELKKLELKKLELKKLELKKLELKKLELGPPIRVLPNVIVTVPFRIGKVTRVTWSHVITLV
jgi:hypothetical protein